ncbi:MAG: glycosyltransferase family 1 protein [Patescibacteria group bacterium]|nr:glycosyltransferase family 1 protein [Patescibacteria group bacterium]
MNIAVDIRALNNKKLTGIGKYIFYALEYILENDKKNKYYLFSSGRKPLSKEQLPSTGNFEYIHIKVPNKVLNFALWANWLKLDKLLPAQIDLFWLPNLNFARFSQGVDYVLTVHDLSFLHSREFYSLKRRWWHKLIDVPYLLTRARQVIAVSYNTKRDILRFFPLDEKKIKIINPGIYNQKIEASRVREILVQYNLDKKYFLYLGTLEPRKNILSIVKAFDHFHRDYPDYQLLIVGGKGWIYNRLLRLIKKKDYVRYLGYVDGEQKDALYSLCQAFIWPSFYEGYGFPPLEALAHGKPLIVSYKTSLPETLKTAAIYVDPYNISDIYQAMISLEKDQLLTQELKQRAREFALPSWRRQSREIIDCLMTKTIPK